MNFLIILVLKYAFCTAILFLTGVFLNCFFDGE
jgi:hypothetical protein